MACLKQKPLELLITIEDKLITYNSESLEHKVITIPEPVVPKDLTPGQENVIKQENREITSLCYSKDYSYLVICTQNKQLVVYDCKFNVIKNVVTNRVVSKVRFTNNNDILVADKTGDAYLYMLNEKEDSPEILLGHLSMLLDILLTDCGKYIVTCDRDEKIRVSCFPNAYNIVSYCLGHTEFVTNLEYYAKTLISASGDGTIRFWNILNGVELHIINTNMYVEDKNILNSFSEQMNSENVEINALPISDMQVFENTSVYIAVSLINFNGIQIYSVDINNSQIKSSLVQNVCLSSLAAFSFNNNFYILTNNDLLMYELNSDNRHICKNSDKLRLLYDSYKYLLEKCKNSVNISILYKRKFDNVQEYLQRKKLRMEGKN